MELAWRMDGKHIMAFFELEFARSGESLLGSLSEGLWRARHIHVFDYKLF